MGNQGLIKHTAQPSAQGRLVASTSVLAIRGAPAAAPAGAGAGRRHPLGKQHSWGSLPHHSEAGGGGVKSTSLGDSRRSRGYRGHLLLSGSAAECLDKGTNVGTKPGLGAVQ